MHAANINAERQFQINDSRMLRNEDKYLDRMEILEGKADAMVGELSSGKCYVYPVGGKYREGTRAELIAFLIRNKYVSVR